MAFSVSVPNQTRVSTTYKCEQARHASEVICYFYNKCDVLFSPQSTTASTRTVTSTAGARTTLTAWATRVTAWRTTSARTVASSAASSTTPRAGMAVNAREY